ncbi:XRE family transcriptional regulator [Verticiella sediminum]|uniref:XRE family transcriptional regulator n=1 Tax=Verticiella sediminum TaxID=1247510 RepID=A0A556ACR4_9BURK|nr:XRE family transcriptional regulator [Verticiella sediminum]TSH90682.1 XRE family transcriptional regulator [Verticiella sediminum]
MLHKSIVSVPDQGEIEIHHSSGNVYADLDIPDAERMLAKSRLIMQLNDAIKARQWSRKKAAAVLGLSTSALSRVLRGQFRAYQVDDVAGWLNKARDAVK